MGIAAVYKSDVVVLVGKLSLFLLVFSLLVKFGICVLHRDFREGLLGLLLGGQGCIMVLDCVQLLSLYCGGGPDSQRMLVLNQINKPWELLACSH